MARLNRAIKDDSGDEFPDLSKVLNNGNFVSTPPRTTVGKERSDSTQSNKQTRRQRPLGSLKLTQVNSLLLPLSKATLSFAKNENSGSRGGSSVGNIRASPKRAVKAPINYSKLVGRLTDAEPSTPEESDSYTDLSGFIVSDSASEAEDVWREKSRKRRQRSPQKPVKDGCVRTKGGNVDLFKRKQESVTVDLATPRKEKAIHQDLDAPLSTTGSATAIENDSGLTVTDEPFATLRL